MRRGFRDRRPAARRGWGDPFRPAVPQAVLYYSLAVLLAIVGGLATERVAIRIACFAVAVAFVAGAVLQLGARRFADANRWALRVFVLGALCMAAGLLTQHKPQSADECAPLDTSPVCIGVPPNAPGTPTVGIPTEGR